MAYIVLTQRREAVGTFRARWTWEQQRRRRPAVRWSWIGIGWQGSGRAQLVTRCEL